MKLTRREFNTAGLAAVTALAAGGKALAGPEHMIRKAIPATGETLPVIGLGTNRYGVGDDAAARAPLAAALKRFAELGGAVVDTAPMYRSSESVLGDLIAGLDIRDELFLATKTDRDDGPAATREQLDRSASRLQTGKIELVQVHNLIGWRKALPVLRDWKAAGHIRYIGITTSRENQYEEFEAVMRAEELDFIQVNYSVEQRIAAQRILPLAADRGMGVIINRAFGGGRIFGAVGDQPLPDWAGEFDCASWAQLLLKYAVSHPAATLAIPGMTKVRHVEDNMMAGHGRLPDAAERKRIETFYDAL